MHTFAVWCHVALFFFLFDVEHLKLNNSPVKNIIVSLPVSVVIHEKTRQLLKPLTLITTLG